MSAINPPEESTKERILRVSTELFARNGYHATGVQEISEAVGLGRGALYHHIESKEELLYRISMSLLDEMIERAEQVAMSEIPPDEQMYALARDLLRNLAEHRDGWSVSLSESRSLSPERRAEVTAARDRYEEVWAKVLRRGVAEGSLRNDSPLVRRGILGMLNSAHTWIQARGDMAPEAIAQVYLDLLMDGLRPHD